jgi:hypothetical protein
LSTCLDASDKFIALGIATAYLIVRTVFRSVELSGGSRGHSANSEVQFMVVRELRSMTVEGMRGTMISLLKLRREVRYGVLSANIHHTPLLALHVTDIQGTSRDPEAVTMVLDGVVVIITCTCLTIFHPGIRFGDRWAEAKFPFGQAVVESDPEVVVEDAGREKLGSTGKEGTTMELGESS